MKKIFISLVFFLSCFFAFSLESRVDIVAGGYYNYTNVFSGSASYQEYRDYNYYTYDGDYRAIYNAGGVFIGYDWLFDTTPFGMYFRAGFMNMSGVNRTAGGKTVDIKNTEITLNMFYDFGALYSLEFNNYISLCVAPAVSLLYIDSEYHNLYNVYNSRATIDSLFGVGFTADVYAKIHYKYFVTTAGCAASFYPLSLVTSADSSINYSTNIRNTLSYNLRPYVCVGVSIPYSK